MRLWIDDVAGETVLSGATNGKAVFVKLVERARPEPKEPAALVIDFNSVDIATASFLRESVFSIKRYMRAINSRFYPIVANVNEHVSDDLGVVADALGDAILACNMDDAGNASSVRLLGSLDPKQQMTFDCVMELEVADANGLMTRFGEAENTRSTTAWNNRLAALVARGLILEFPSGRAKFYKPIIREMA